MAKAWLKCLVAAIGLLGASQAAMADTSNYTVFTNAAGDIYLKAKEQFVLIHSDVSVPIFVMPKDGYQKAIRDANGNWITSVLTVDQWNALNLVQASQTVNAASELTALYPNGTSGSGPIVADPAFIKDVPTIEPLEVPAFVNDNLAVQTIPGDINIDNQGGANYTVPINIPRGIGGFQPELEISYSSNGDNGLLGLGWSISDGDRIQRCTKTLEDEGQYSEINMTEQDKLCLGSKKLRLISGTYLQSGSEYRLEKSPDVKITQTGNGSGSVFEVFKASGEKITYGGGSESVIDLSSGKTLFWLKKSSKNSFGQEIKYTYSSSNSVTKYLKEIEYSGNKISFSYEDRPDKSASYYQGNLILGDVRLKTIVTSSHNYGNVFIYTLNYEQSKFSSQSLLSSVTLCDGYNSDACAKSTTFEYSDFDLSGFSDDIKSFQVSDYVPIFTETNCWNPDPSFNNSGYCSVYKITAADMDNDGIAEVVVSAPDKTNGNTETANILAFDVSNDNVEYKASASKLQIDLKQWRLKLVNQPVRYNFPWMVIEPENSTKRNYVYFNWGYADWDGDGVDEWSPGRTEEALQAADALNWSNTDGSGVEAYLYGRELQLIDHYFDYNNDGLIDRAIPVELCAVDYWPESGYTSYRCDEPKHFIEINQSTTSGHSGRLASTTPSSLFSALDASGDINGDGLTDLIGQGVYGESGYKYIRINNGRNFGFADHNFTMPNTYCLGDVECFPSLVDINGDGNDDYVHLANGKIYAAISQKDGFSESVVVGSPNVSKPVIQVTSATWSDLDGDQQPDLAIFDHSTGKVSVVFDRNTDNVVLDKLITVNTGLGKKYNIQYKRLTDPSVYTLGTGAELLKWGKGSKVRDIVSSSAVVSSLRETVGRSHGFDLTEITSYAYKGLRSQAGGQGSLGFEEVAATIGSKKITTTKKFLQQPPYNGQIKEVTRTLENGDVIDKQAVTNWTALLVNDGQDQLVLPAETVKTVYQVDGDGAKLNSSKASAVITVSENYELTANGYPLLKWRKSVTSDLVDAGSSTQLTTFEYTAEDSANWFINRPTSVVTVFSREGNNDVTQSMQYSYSTEQNYIEEQIREPNSDDKSLYLKTHFEYDDVGNLTQQTECSLDFASVCSDAETPVTADSTFKVFRRTLFKYDDAGRYLLTEANPLFKVKEYYQYNRFGIPEEVRYFPSEGVVGMREYSKFGPLGIPYFTYTNQGQWNKSIASPCPLDSDCPDSASFMVEKSGSSTPTEIGYFDYQGNEVRVAKQLVDGQWSYVNKVYDVSGRLVQHSQPSLDRTVVLWSTYTHYDALDRKYLITSPDGLETKYSYTGNETKQSVKAIYIDEAQSKTIDNTRTEFRNGRGDIIKVVDPQNNSSHYEYAATGQLKRLTGVDKVDTELEFDSYGRRTRLLDPDKGDLKFTFNALGEEVSKTAPDNTARTSFMNAIGQVVKTTVTGPNGGSTHVFNYGGTAKLQFKQSGNALTSYTYDSFDRLIGRKYDFDSNSWQDSVVYDQFGRLFREMDASGQNRGIQYQYTNGHLDSIFEVKTGMSYYKLKQSDAYGSPSLAEVGPKIRLEKEYDQLTGRLRAIIAGAGAIQYQQFRYDQLGNLRYRSNLSSFGISDLEESFGYDELNRLTTVKLNSLLTQSISYLENGSINTKSDVEAGSYYQYGTKEANCAVTAGVHAVTKVGNRTYCYDARGNQTDTYRNGVSDRKVTYTSYDLPSRIYSSQGETLFDYDADEKMYKRVDRMGSANKTTYFTNDVEVIFNPDGTSEFKRYINDIAIHTVKSSGVEQLNYLFSDHLSSMGIVTNERGNVIETASYDAFGKRRDAKSWANLANPFAQLPNLQALLKITQRGYTGHQQVDHASIIHMQGRIYDPELGRFAQADPIVEDAHDAQTLNRYSYVLNNPLSYTDPTGYTCTNPQSPKGCSGSIKDKKGEKKTADRAQAKNDRPVTYEDKATKLTNSAAAAGGADKKDMNSDADIDAEPLRSIGLMLGGIGKLLLEGASYLGEPKMGMGGQIKDLCNNKGSCVDSSDGIDGQEALTIASSSMAVLPIGRISKVSKVSNVTKVADKVFQLGDDLVKQVAQQQYQAGFSHLKQFMTPKEIKAYLADPAKGSRFIGHAVHRSTDAALQEMYPGRFDYNPTRAFDFLDKATGQAIELTTQKGLKTHQNRAADTVTYN